MSLRRRNEKRISRSQVPTCNDGDPGGAVESGNRLGRQRPGEAPSRMWRDARRDVGIRGFFRSISSAVTSDPSIHALSHLGRRPRVPAGRQYCVANHLILPERRH